MQYLAFAVLLIVSFNQLLRSSQGRGSNAHLVGAVNYVVAALVSVTLLLVYDPSWRLHDGHWPFWLIGLVNGVFYCMHLQVMLESYRHAGVGITIALVASGVVLPMLASWTFWAEPMTPARWMTLAMLPPAMLLLRPATGSKPAAGSTAAPPTHHLTLRDDLVLFLVFFIGGTILVIHKAVNQYGAPLPDRPQRAYQAALFTAAAMVGVACIRRGGKERPPRDLLVGGLAGAANATNTLVVLLALRQIPAVVFFPSLNCLALLFNAILARLFWSEKITPRQLVGLLMAVAIVVMVNL